MPQLYCQLASRPDPWLIGRTSAGLCTLQTACPLTVTYSGGAPAPDTIAAGSAATVYGGSAATFDASADVWVVLTVAGSGALQVVKEADLATVTGDWAGLARVVQHSTEPYQPQAYLAAGGLGNPPSTSVALLSAAGAHRVYSLGYHGAYAGAPAGWETPAFADSGWALSQLQTGESAFYTPPTGAVFETANPAPSGLELRFLLRAAFTLGPGVPTGASLLLTTDDGCNAAYLNGTALVLSGSHATGAAPQGPATTALPPALLLPGGTNVLALDVQDGNLSGISIAAVAFALLVQYGATAPVPDPGGHEGDLLYYHAGAWTDLPIGTSGQELTVVAGDPAWTDQPADTDTAGTVTSVQVAVPAPLGASGGPITASGTITLAWASGQSANRVLASPDGTTGAVSLRALVGNDIPVDASTIIASAGTIKGNYQAGSGVSISGNTISATGSGGSVTSVALTMPSGVFSTSGSPVTTSGTLAVSLQSQAAHTFWGGPASGSSAAPTFRALQGSDLPAATGAGGKIHAHGHFI